MHFPKAARSIGTAALALTIGIAILYRHQRPRIVPRSIILPADGAEHDALRIRLPELSLGSNVTEATGIRLLQANDPHSLEGVIQSPITPGNANLRLRWRDRVMIVPVTYFFDPSDTYGDGTPDFLRLHTSQDRQAFRAWFTSIAEGQLDQPICHPKFRRLRRPSPFRLSRNPASPRRNLAWQPPQGSRPTLHHPIHLPPNPIRREPLPRPPRPIPSPGPQNGAFAQFADAQTLMQRNTYLIGRDLRLARPGDLIFYRQLDQESPYDVPDVAHYHSPFHSMIFCGEMGVVYHTGPIHHGKGEMRRLLVSDLLHHPDARWRPLPENTNFLGVYRWNILREGD